MILGIGNDIIEIARIRAVLEKYPDRFLKRLLTSYEQAYCLRRKDPAIHLAGLFAAKEAVAKALGTGLSRGVEWHDIEIRHTSLGKPYVACSENLKELFNHPHIEISISHCQAYATAFAIWWKSSTN